AYELRLALTAAVAATATPAVTAFALADAGQLEDALDGLREALLAIGYLSPANPEAILAEIRHMLARARPTTRETTLLRGLARQILWAGRHIASGPEAGG